MIGRTGSDTHHGRPELLSQIPNRQLQLLEARLTRSKQTIGHRSNRQFSETAAPSDSIEYPANRVLASAPRPDSSPRGRRATGFVARNPRRGAPGAPSLRDGAAGGGFVMRSGNHRTESVRRNFPARNACHGGTHEEFVILSGVAGRVLPGPLLRDVRPRCRRIPLRISASLSAQSKRDPSTPSDAAHEPREQQARRTSLRMTAWRNKS